MVLFVLTVNPFSAEAERIVKNNQGKKISGEVFDHARKIVSWRSSETRKKVLPADLKSGYDQEIDVLAQRLLFLSVAVHYTPYSNELRLVRESVQDIVKARLLSLDLRFESEVVRKLSDLFDIIQGAPTVEGGLRFGSVFVPKSGIFSQGQLLTRDGQRLGEPWRVKYGVSWRELIRLIRARELRFMDLYLEGGLALFSLMDLIEHYSKLIGLLVEDYIAARFEDFQSRKTPEIKSLEEETAALADYLGSIAAQSYKGFTLQSMAGRLKRDNFPPCIRGIISGVETGSRNYAISVLLTSFISYARIAPKKVRNPRVSDYVKDPKVLTDEILPVIYEAAARCKPPLFEDQPMEKMNVHYHLGLGLSSDVRLENSGSSHWYFPPNCEKIRRESPGLCRPDETCRQIKNPLTYYFVKFRKGDTGEKEVDWDE